jgi:hypothetical protein
VKLSERTDAMTAAIRGVKQGILAKGQIFSPTKAFANYIE